MVRGVYYGGNGVWHDATGSAYPDWVQIAFAGTRTIDQINVFTVQDAWSAPSEPTPGMTWSQWAVKNFTVFYWTGSTWQTVPNGVVSDNNLVWRSITFPPLTTSHIVVWIEGATDGWSRLTEIEAFASNRIGPGFVSSVNTPPAVSLTSPADGASSAAPATVTFAATASDADGTVQKVEFYVGATLVGTDTSSPYSMTWSAPIGSHSVAAVATDNLGAVTVSSWRSFTVTAAPLVSTAVFRPAIPADKVDYYVLEVFAMGADPSTAAPVATQVPWPARCRER